MGGEKILIVDDERIIARELEERLTSFDYEVLGIASTGAEAIRLAEEKEPQLVLMDIVLKGEMDGIEAATKIRQKMDIPVIFLSAYTDKETLARAKISEPYGYIVKPFSGRDLQANIEMALFKHHVEAKLRQIEKWFSASMMGVGDGVCATTNSNDTITYLNPIAEIMLGISLKDAVGKKIENVLRFVDQNSMTLDKTPIDRIFEEGIVTDMSEELYISNAHDDVIPIAYTGACLRDADDNPSGVVIWLKDISDQKYTQKLLKKSEQTLLQTQRIETIGVLAGAVAHDFNNEISIVLGCADSAMEHGDLDETTTQLIEEIRSSSLRSAALTRKLLIFGQKHLVDITVFDINELITSLHTMLIRLIGEEYRLTAELNSTLNLVSMDRVQLEQLIVNLVVNARDALSEGGTICIRTNDVKHDDTFFRTVPDADPDEYLQLEVFDNGCGMTEEVKSHLFEPFYTTKGLGKGTGLGLSTVYGIVKDSGGYLNVISEVDQGALFQIYLKATKEGLPATADLDTDEVVFGKETILVVEDNDALRNMTVEFLKIGGYDVLEASSGIEAIDIFNENSGIKLVITDVVMPGISGKDLIKKLQDIRMDLKVLFVSGYTADEVIQRGVIEHEIEFLQKPYTMHVLVQKIRKMLDRAV